MKHRFVYSILVMSLALMIGLGGCDAGGQTSATTAKPAGTTPKAASWETIGAADAKKRMDASKGFLLLDVRTPDEFAGGHIPGAVNIEYQNIVKGLADRKTPKDQAIYVYCRSGNRSATASRSLAEAGYTGVVDFGGIIDWPYEVVKGS